MRRLFFASTVYRVLEAEIEGIPRYGLCAMRGGEAANIPDITSKREDLLALLAQLERADVPPLALRDVVEDWLER